MCLFSVKLLKEVSNSVPHSCTTMQSIHYFSLLAVFVYKDLFDHDHLTKCLLNWSPSLPCAIVHDVPERMTVSPDYKWIPLKVPYYTVFHQFHIAVRDSSVFDMHCPKLIHGPEFQLSKSCSTELYSEQSVSVPAPLNANELRLSMPT